jgi:hypothetical protein
MGHWGQIPAIWADIRLPKLLPGGGGTNSLTNPGCGCIISRAASRSTPHIWLSTTWWILVLLSQILILHQVHIQKSIYLVLPNLNRSKVNNVKKVISHGTFHSFIHSFLYRAPVTGLGYLIWPYLRLYRVRSPDTQRKEPTYRKKVQLKELNSIIMVQYFYFQPVTVQIIVMIFSILLPYRECFPKTLPYRKGQPYINIMGRT